MSLEVIFRMNGVRAAFIGAMGPEPAYRPPACPAANTSASLIIRQKEGDQVETVANVLFDCGEGVVASLAEFGLSEVTHCFLTHNHLDHIYGLDGLMVTQRSSGGVCPLPVYCTPGTWADGPLGRFPWLSGLPAMRSDLVAPAEADPDPLLIHQPITPFQPLALGLGIDLRVTPIPVYHGPSGIDPVIYVIEFGDPADDTYRKIGLFWDQMHFVPRYPWEERDAYYVGPVTQSTEWLAEHAALLADLDEVFIDSSFRTPFSYISHRSLEASLAELLPRLKPARVWITHYDGSLDPGGTLPPAALKRWVDEHRDRCSPDLPIEIATHGMTFAYHF